MSEAKNEKSPNQGKDNAEQAQEPRKKTPLEMIRERQAKLRGSQQASTPGASDTESSGPASSYKRRLHQRKSG